MASYQVSVVNEDWKPLAAVLVDAISLNNWPQVADTQQTAQNGSVQFRGLYGPHFFRARTRRVSGDVGDKKFTGDVKVLVVALGEGVNVDYVVDSNGMGTHRRLFGPGGALRDAVATAVSKTIWVCTSHVEPTVTAGYEWTTALATNQKITILSAGRHRPVILINTTDPLFFQVSGETHATNSALRIQGLAFSRAGGSAGDFYRAAGGVFTPDIELEDVTFKGGWLYGFNWNTVGSANVRKTHLRRVTSEDTFTGLVDVSSAMSNLGTFILNDVEFAVLTYIVHRSNSTDLDAGTSTIVLNNRFLSITGAIGLNPLGNLYFIGNNPVNFSGVTTALQIGTAGVTAPTDGGADSVVDGNFIYCSTGGASAIILTAGSGTMKNISMIGNALRGPGSGTAILYNKANVDCPAFNAYRDWDNHTGGTVGPGAGSFTGAHSTLTGLVAPADDHTQYVYLTGRAGGQTIFGGTGAGDSLTLKSTSHATKGYIIVAAGEQLQINDPTYLLFRTTAAGGSANYGYTTIGGTTYTVSATQADALQILIPVGSVTSLSVYGKASPFDREAIFMLYDNDGAGGSPGTLLAYTAQIVIPSAGAAWNTAAIAFNVAGGAISSYTISVAKNYWVASLYHGGGGLSIDYKYDAGGVSYEGNAMTWPTPETTWSGGAAGTKNLSMYATATSNTVAVYIYFNGSSNKLIFDPTNVYYQFYVAGAEQARITAGTFLFSGSLRVGTIAAPSALLHLSQQTVGNEVFRIESVATNDDPRESVYQQRVATTDATVTTLHTITIPASTTVGIVVEVTARRTGGAAGTAEDGARYLIAASVKNVAGTATLLTAGATANPLKLVEHEDQAGWDATIDVTGATARVRVTGAVNNSIVWHCTVRIWPVGS